MNDSLKSIFPRVCKSVTMAFSIRSSVPSRTHPLNRRWQVWYDGNSLGRSFHRAPVRKPHKMPSSTWRSSRRGRPLPFFTATRCGFRISHCVSVSSIGDLLFHEVIT